MQEKRNLDKKAIELFGIYLPTRQLPHVEWIDRKIRSKRYPNRGSEIGFSPFRVAFDRSQNWSDPSPGLIRAVSKRCQASDLAQSQPYGTAGVIFLPQFLYILFKHVSSHHP